VKRVHQKKGERKQAWKDQSESKGFEERRTRGGGKNLQRGKRQEVRGGTNRKGNTRS